MLNEIDVLRDITNKLEKADIDYMLTGSFAMNYYTIPRMTRDLDIVVQLKQESSNLLFEVFEPDYYLTKDAIKKALKNNSMFNLIHNKSIIKVDLIIKKDEEFHNLAFSRKKRLQITDFEINCIGKEDLILSKLLWSRNSHSEIQKQDIRNLVRSGVDDSILQEWLKRLDLEKYFQEICG